MIRIATRSFSSLYVQGQSPAPKIREYFYYIDHQGQLFLDDIKIKNFVTSYKDKKFLQFFFKRIRINNTGRYQEEFPFISPCGREINYIRCDDVPIVFTHLVEESLSDISKIKKSKYPATNFLSYAGSSLSVPFSPRKLCMLPKSGRIYHPAPRSVGRVGLIKSSLAIEISSGFRYDMKSDENSPPSVFFHQGIEYNLDNEILKYLPNDSVPESENTL
ncbi:UPF0598 protein C8orf82-like protein [Trichoplax sp. H2]|nr:UPF0598 protein C8orf82-like protein [Trichoplax sp. H2]|eukprot:RDD47231.1 UPF0598 protein C8orf82-like protein [Trichoplax sp. H2]